MEWKTTFWSDFSIADRFGIEAVKDTFNRAFGEWKNNHVYLTELVIVLNWKLWAHYDNGNVKMAKAYDGLWREAADYAANNLKGKELEYYYQMTD